MKRSFTRVLWGSENQDEIIHSFSLMNIDLNEDMIKHLIARRWKTQQDIIKQQTWKFPLTSFVTYVYGKSNKDILDRMGMQNVLINKNPYVLPYKRAYIHKLFSFQNMMEDFDEIVFLDWDTKLIKEIPENFWDELNKKASFQASLWRYKKSKINHRGKRFDNRMCPAAGFVYIRDKNIPKRLMELWKVSPNSWSEEPAFALLTDEMTGGWKGLKTYWELFEPECYKCVKSPYSYSRKENACFLNIGKPWSF